MSIEGFLNYVSEYSLIIRIVFIASFIIAVLWYFADVVLNKGDE